MIDLEALGRRVMACPGFTWTLPWCLLPDSHGRVWRRNWCPDDTGFGFTQVFGPVLRAPRDRDQAVVDLRDPASEGCLLHLVRKVSGDPDAYVARVTSIAAWVVFVRGQEPVESYEGRVDALVCAWERLHGRMSLRLRGGSR